jgi:hypothetical protein
MKWESAIWVLKINVDLTLISAIAAASWVLNEWRENVSLVGLVEVYRLP